MTSKTEPYHIFTHIPKTGGTSMVQALLHGHRQVEYGFDKNYTPYTWSLKNPNPPVVREKHAELFWMKEALGEDFNKYWKFAMVRNPWERAVSLYFFGSETQGFMDHFGSFEAWAIHHWGRGDEKIRRKTIQSSWLTAKNGDWLVDDIFKLEEIEDIGLKVISERLERPDLLEHRFPYTNRARSDYGDWKDHHTDRTIELVAGMDKDVIERFGYTYA